LLNVVKNESVDRSKAYNLLYKNLKRNNIDLALTYLEKAYQEAEKHNNKKQLGAYYNYIGYYYKSIQN
jgi:hypothetical protein